MPGDERNPVSKTLAVLSWMIESAPDMVGVRELSAAMDLSPSSAHRLLSALVAAGYVKQDPTTARYGLGLELLRLSHLASARMPIQRIALPHMRALVDRCNETALLASYDPNRRQMIFLANVDSSHSLRYVVELDRWAPVFAGASGLAILAFLDRDQQRAILDDPSFRPITPHTLGKLELAAELDVVARQGYAVSRGQRIQGAVGLAAPIRDSHGDVIGDVCLTIPEQRFSERLQPLLVEQLLSCTEAITGELSGRSPRQRRAG